MNYFLTPRKMTPSFVILVTALAMISNALLATHVSGEDPEGSTTTTLFASSSGSGDSYGLDRDMFGHQYNPRVLPMTCDRFPRVCRAMWSPGPDCCRKSCVNVMTDGLNCGQCGRKCRYGEACCGGSCVNVMYDAKNCGRCKNRCKKGTFCRYGMCSYAY